MSFSRVSVDEGTRVEVEAFAAEYMELALDSGPARLVVDWFANPVRSRLELIEPLPGDGILGAILLSLSFDKVIFFGLEKSFIFELFAFGSLSGRGPGGGGGIICCGGAPGDGNGLLPLGYAAFAALAAASRLPPTVPLEYVKPPADVT